MQLYDISNTWIPWIESGLLGILLLTCVIQPRAIIHSVQTVASPMQRRYVSGTNNPLLLLLKGIFQFGTIALALTTAVAAWKGVTNITWQMYGIATAILVVIMVVKMILNQWIQVTFHYAINRQTYNSYHSELWQMVSVALWINLLFHPWMSTLMQWLIPAVVLGIYFALIGWKMMQAFGWSIKHVGYNILYMVHVEILPWIVAVEVLGNRY